MKTTTARRVGWGAVALFVVLTTFGLWATVVAQGWAEAADDFVFAPVLLTFAVVGALVVSRSPRNAAGWLFLAIGFSAAVAFPSDAYARWGLQQDPAMPGVVWTAWLGSWLWIGFIAPTVVFLPLLFPDGRFLSPRWRVYAAVSSAFLLFTAAGFALDPGPLPEYGIPNPLGVEALAGVAEFMDGAGFTLAIVLAIVSASSLVLRFRRADRKVRQQIKWFVFAVSLLAVWFLASGISELLGGWPEVFDIIGGAVVFLSLPVGAGIGILRYRLFDIDVVVNRTVMYAIVAAVFTGVYVGVVVGLGTLVGARGSPFLTAVATALIAVGFHPLREQARHLANRLVYGKRATPYELLSEFSQRLGETYSSEDVLPRVARLVGEGTGAARAGVWLRVGGELRAAASWPDAGDDPVIPLAGDDLPERPAGQRAFAVRHQGELLGALSVLTRPGETLTPTQEKLLEDLASQAGLVLRNVRLIEELRASRQRLVAAQDDERRRLERDIHDGAQQQLVALAVNLKLARSLAAKDPGKAAAVMDRLVEETQQALESLRDLARGIYPPLLADKGLLAALEAQARKAPMPVAVEANGRGRFSQEVEAAAYFCVLEALQNAAKYADASRVAVRLHHGDRNLFFEVNDDGKGFDPATTPRGSGLQNMVDRLEALGGGVDVASTPGQGTSVRGRIPLREATA